MRQHPAAHWSSRADPVVMIQERHPEVVAVLDWNLTDDTEATSMTIVQEYQRILMRAGFELPSWEQLTADIHTSRR